MTDANAGIPTPRARVPDPSGDPRETISAPTVARRARTPNAGRPTTETVPVEVDDERRVTATIERLPRVSLELGPGTWSEEDRFTFRGDHDADLTLVGILGKGGMGRVLLAHQQSLRRDVAVKVLHEGLEYGSLLAEARLAGQLEHPNIVPVHALGKDAVGRPVLVLKRIEGVRWKELLADPEHPFWAKIPAGRGDRLLAHVQVLMQACNALHFAHSRGVVHRDVKPDNVMIGAFGEVYVTDWGVATRSARLGSPAAQTTGASAGREIVGTPAYLAPEMLFGDPDLVDARTDVFLLGATLHEVLTGHPRHAGRSVKAALEAAYAVAPFAYGPDVPAELATIANRATTGDPDTRYADAQAMRDALASWVEHRGAATLTEAAGRRLEELRGLFWREGEGVGGEHHEEALRLIAECRFAYGEALRAWPAQPAARDGLREALRLALAHEVARGDVAAARNALREAEAAGLDVPSDLRARYVALRDADERTRSRAAELEKLAHDLDLSVAARERRLLFGAVTIVSGVGLFLLFAPRMTSHPGPLGFSRLLVLPTLWIAAIAAASLIWRERLLVNAANRRAMALTAGGMALVVLHRLGGLRVGMPAMNVVLGDHMVMLAVTAAMAITVNPRFWPAPAAFLASFAMCMLVPERMLAWFMIACTVLLVSLMRAVVFLPGKKA